MQVYTVTELAGYLKAILEGDPQLRDVWVSGEVSSLTRSAAGHSYFTLKDAGAALQGVLFAGDLGAEHLDNGAQVNAHGRVSFYLARGVTQIIVDAVVPAGLGALAAEFERLRAMLEREGLFDESRKRPLPPFPQTVGVVTSESGAVIHDIVNVLSERYPLVELVLCPASVQGEGAPEEIVDGIRSLNALGGVDVIIVGRGGGSMEDLWAFNTEEVARAIHASHVPIVSAVGHESDFTIADFVADLRAPTPSAAAAAVTPDAAALGADVVSMARRSRNAVAHLLSRMARDVEAQVGQMQRRLPDIPTSRQRIDDVLGRGRAALAALLDNRKQQTAGLAAALTALNPAAVLDRGFAVITNPATGATISTVADVARGDNVRATVRDGHFDAEVL
ncbi:MAG: exodeoxyribonuclease VII large subunit [Chloroflexi bacterium]|nr:exodeoxyribonuclease VII large subunit [Chloroflexota bacterium]